MRVSGLKRELLTEQRIRLSNHHALLLYKTSIKSRNPLNNNFKQCLVHSSKAQASCITDHEAVFYPPVPCSPLHNLCYSSVDSCQWSIHVGSFYADDFHLLTDVSFENDLFRHIPLIDASRLNNLNDNRIHPLLGPSGNHHKVIEYITSLLQREHQLGYIVPVDNKVIHKFKVV